MEESFSESGHVVGGKVFNEKCEEFEKLESEGLLLIGGFDGDKAGYIETDCLYEMFGQPIKSWLENCEEKNDPDFNSLVYDHRVSRYHLALEMYRLVGRSGCPQSVYVVHSYVPKESTSGDVRRFFFFKEQGGRVYRIEDQKSIAEFC